MSTLIDAGAQVVLGQHARAYNDWLMACWFSLPRAVEVDGRCFIGGVAPLTPIAGSGDAMYDNPALSFFPENIGDPGGAMIVIETGEERRHSLGDSFSDDHNNPALLIESGKPPLVFLTEHNGTHTVEVRKGTTPGDLTTLGSSTFVDFSHLATGYVSYAQVHRRPGTDDLILLSRCGIIGGSPITGNPRYWAFSTSDDYGDTWTLPVALIDWQDQGYILSRTVGDTVHLIASMHPARDYDQSIWHLAINMVTGSITAADGTVLGNLDGTGLPFDPEDMDLVAAVTEPRRTWILDCGPAAEMVWHEFDVDDRPNGIYRHGRWESGAWVVTDIVGSGGGFGDTGPGGEADGTGSYQGGACVDSTGDVFLSRRHDGDTWSIERWTRTGETWAVAETIAASATRRLVRPYVPVGRTTGPRVVWASVRRYATPGIYDAYTAWEGNP